MIRVLHFSDVHLHAPLLQLVRQAFGNKRMLGIANLLFHRKEYFQHASQKLEALGRFSSEQRIDLVICTGDYTVVGTEAEWKLAREAVEPLTHARLGFVTVPGNHDIYLEDAVRTLRLERHFGRFLGTDCPEYRVDKVWPQIRLIEDSVACIAINSARPNPQPWRSSGRIPEAQLESLQRALGDERIRNRFVFVITHYALLRGDGSKDSAAHGLENADELLEVCSRVQHGAIIHGHIHSRFHLQPSPLSIPIFNAGSATHEGRESAWIYEIEHHKGRAIPVTWQKDHYETIATASVLIGGTHRGDTLL